VTHTTTVKLPTIKAATQSPVAPATQIATTAAQAEHGSAIFTGCAGDWGLRAAGRIA
jgi:hypothetical protein